MTNSYVTISILPKASAHALIGRYVYLRYLKDRNILSERKLARWNIKEDDVFSRDAYLNPFWQLVDNVDEWLNGALFPLSAEQRKLINLNHLRLVSGTFAGDEPSTRQLHLDFQAYDFSFIPIETLSNIYEQFLHTTDNETESKGKKNGAYYTPIPLVNFMLEEIDAKCPLSNGMKILDPTCGSGAFLVQVYRRIIEKELIAGKKSLTPVELRDLLTKHIFGVDKDPDACGITELSLQLTLLDYLNPPDLENNPRFKLPDLRNKNIYEADFFDLDSEWFLKNAKGKFDWIVGNPPWVEISEKNKDEHSSTARWINENKKNYPTGGNQTAEAFAWKIKDAIADDGAIAFLMPAMTLFKTESTRFRQQFFSQMDVWCVANFANLANFLFAGRITIPACCIFFGMGNEEDVNDKFIATYSPMVVN